jgi:hypothetical protein
MGNPVIPAYEGYSLLPWDAVVSLIALDFFLEFL